MTGVQTCALPIYFLKLSLLFLRRPETKTINSRAFILRALDDLETNENTASNCFIALVRRKSALQWTFQALQEEKQIAFTQSTKCFQSGKHQKHPKASRNNFRIQTLITGKIGTASEMYWPKSFKYFFVVFQRNLLGYLRIMAIGVGKADALLLHRSEQGFVS